MGSFAREQQGQYSKGKGMKKNFTLEIPALVIVDDERRDKWFIDHIRKANDLGLKGFEIKEIVVHDDSLSDLTRITVFRCERISVFERIALFLNKIFGVRA
jgi:hypothetical protein